MKIASKQKQVLDAVKNERYSQIFLIGPLGSNKTFAMAYAHINIARQFKGSFIPVARKTLSEARIGTVLSYLEVLDTMGMIEGVHYVFLSGGEIKIRFSNKSVIQFVPLDQTKDRNWQRVKSINATCEGIDEVDGVAYEGYLMFLARRGRKKTGAPECLIATCNPNDAWVKEHIYDPWKKGTLPYDICVIEFQMEDSFLYPTGYYRPFFTNPPQWQQRYLYNNWDYQDDDNSLFKNSLLNSIFTGKYRMEDEGYHGTDVAREGKDRSVLVEIRGNTLVNIDIYTREDLARLAPENQKDAIPYGPILSREIIKYCTERGIGYKNAACDAVGNGGGVVDSCRESGFKLNEFKAGGSPIKNEGAKDLRTPRFSVNYDMLRSQVFHQLALAMEKGEFLFYQGCPHLGDLKKELLYHTFEIKDKFMKVEKKEEIKLRLGKSPDIADAVAIAFYNKIMHSKASRILY